MDKAAFTAWKLTVVVAIIRAIPAENKNVKMFILDTSDIKEKINRRMNSYRPKERVGYFPVFTRASFLEDHVFIVDSVSPRIWIWEVDEKIEIKRRYWADVRNYFLVRDMMAVKENDKIKFYILGDIG